MPGLAPAAPGELPPPAPRPPFRLVPEGSQELLHAFLLCAYAALLGHAWVLHRLTDLPGGMQKFFKVYEQSWVFGMAAAAGAFFLWAVLRWAAQSRALVYSSAVLCALYAALGLAMRQPLETPGLELVVLKSSGLAALAALVLVKLLGARAEAWRPLLEGAALAVAPFMVLAVGLWFNGKPTWDPSLSRLAVVGAFLFAGAAIWEGGRTEWRRWKGLDVLVLLWLVWALFPWRSSYNLHHQDYYLDPANALLNGRSLLAQVKCQYGIFNVYLIAACFRLTGLPASFLGFSALNALSYIAMFAAFWFMVMAHLRSRALAVLAFATLVAFHRWGFPGIGPDVLGYPSMGPWRFGIGLLVLITLAWRSRVPGRSRLPELAAYGLASVWSLEGLVYASAAYVAFCGIEHWSEQKPLAQRLGALMTRVEQMLIAVVCAHAVLALMIRVDAGHWPDYDLYLDFIRQYMAGLAEYPLDFHIAWFLPAAVPMLGMVAVLVLSSGGRKPKEMAIAAGLFAMAAAQYTYFLNRAHPSNLRAITVPTIAGAALCLDLLLAQASVRRLFRWSAAVALCGLFSIVYLQCHWVLLGSQPAQRWVPELQGRPGWSAFWDLLKHPPNLNDRVTAAAELAWKYYPNSKQGTFLIMGEEGPAAHVHAGMIEVSDFTDADQDAITQTGLDGVLDPRLKAGDIVLVEGNTGLYERLTGARYHSLAKRFKLTTLECGPANICAARLDPL
jgi:hypothetical protein